MSVFPCPPAPPNIQCWKNLPCARAFFGQKFAARTTWILSTLNIGGAGEIMIRSETYSHMASIRTYDFIWLRTIVRQLSGYMLMFRFLIFLFHSHLISFIIVVIMGVASLKTEEVKFLGGLRDLMEHNSPNIAWEMYALMHCIMPSNRCLVAFSSA